MEASWGPSRVSPHPRQEGGQGSKLVQHLIQLQQEMRKESRAYKPWRKVRNEGSLPACKKAHATTPSLPCLGSELD